MWTLSQFFLWTESRIEQDIYDVQPHWAIKATYIIYTFHVDLKSTILLFRGCNAESGILGLDDTETSGNSSQEVSTQLLPDLEKQVRFLSFWDAKGDCKVMGKFHLKIGNYSPAGKGEGWKLTCPFLSWLFCPLSVSWGIVIYKSIVTMISWTFLHPWNGHGAENHCKNWLA